MIYKYMILILFLIPSLAAAAGDAYYTQTRDTKKIAWMQRGMDLARQRLKDPESARFRSVYFHQGQLGVPVTCGEVNGKNSFNAYIGYQRFLSAGKLKFTYLSSQVVDFDKLWIKLCRN